MVIEKEEIELEFVLNQEDKNKLTLEMKNTKEIIFYRFVFPIILILMFEAIESLIGIFTGFSIFNIVSMIIVPILILLMIFIFPPFIVNRLVIKEVSPRECEISVNQEGIEADLANVKYSLKWDYFTKVIERRDFIYFYFPQNNPLTIPKRVLDDIQLKQLKNILLKNLENKIVRLTTIEKSS